MDSHQFWKTAELPDGWEVVDESSASKLRLELNRELHPSHQLHGCTVTALARRKGRDDVLFLIHDAPKRFATVHLTWHIERNDEFPWTKVYARYEDWLGERLKDADTTANG